jgi:rubrerythrin
MAGVLREGNPKWKCPTCTHVWACLINDAEETTIMQRDGAAYATKRIPDNASVKRAFCPDCDSDDRYGYVPLPRLYSKGDICFSYQEWLDDATRNGAHVPSRKETPVDATLTQGNKDWRCPSCKTPWSCLVHDHVVVYCMPKEAHRQWAGARRPSPRDGSVSRAECAQHSCGAHGRVPSTATW